MGAKRIEELVAYQFALEFKLEVYRLIDNSPTARRDIRFDSHLREAASSVPSDVGEGFARFRPREFAYFLNCALGSLKESVLRVQDGIHRHHFQPRDCEHALQLGSRCRRTLRNLQAAQERRAAAQDRERKQKGRGRSG